VTGVVVSMGKCNWVDCVKDKEGEQCNWHMGQRELRRGGDRNKDVVRRDEQ